jgi:hypothetical protein
LLDGNTPQSAFQVPIELSSGVGAHGNEAIDFPSHLFSIPVSPSAEEALKSSVNYPILKEHLETLVDQLLQLPPEAKPSIYLKFGKLQLKANFAKVGSVPTNLTQLSEFRANDQGQKADYWFAMDEEMPHSKLDDITSSLNDMGLRREEKWYWVLEVADFLLGTLYRVHVTVDASGEKTYSCFDDPMHYRAMIALPYHKYSLVMRIRSKTSIPEDVMKLLTQFLSDDNIDITSLNCTPKVDMRPATANSRFSLSTWRKVTDVTFTDETFGLIYLHRHDAIAESQLSITLGGSFASEKSSLFITSEILSEKFATKTETPTELRSQLLKFFKDGIQFPYGFWSRNNE